MSSNYNMFPGYISREQFSRPGRGTQVYFSTSEAYIRALQDSNTILDAAYFASPEHSTFLQNFGPSPAVIPDTSYVRRKTLLDILNRYGLLPIKDPMSWASRYSQVASSRVSNLNNYSTATTSELYHLLLNTILDIGLPRWFR
jgi:hypothetical protein